MPCPGRAQREPAAAAHAAHHIVQEDAAAEPILMEEAMPIPPLLAPGGSQHTAAAHADRCVSSVCLDAADAAHKTGFDQGPMPHPASMRLSW